MSARKRDAAGLLAAVKARAKSGIIVRGALRALLAAWKLARLVPGINRLCWTVTVDGFRLRVRLFSYDDLLTASPDYEPLIRELLPERGATAIDAGAYIGRHTIALARAVGPAGRVIAIEPLPENFALLEQNVRLNGATGVTCVPVALGSRDGLGLLTVERETSTARLERDHRPTSGGSRTAVCVRTLDALVEELGLASVDWIKLDVEGAETAVLLGAERLLTGPRRPRLVVEVHSVSPQVDCPVSPGDPGESLTTWFKERGYSAALRLDGRRLFLIADPVAQDSARPPLGRDLSTGQSAAP